MSLSVYIAQSLDGYIAGPNGEIDWLECVPNPDGSDFGFSDFMVNIDALLMGRATFEKLLTFEMWIYDKPVYVASNSLSSIPVEYQDKAFLISGSLDDMLDELARQGKNRIYIDGGKLIQSALAAEKVDELIITTLPILIGEGIPLFANLPNYQQFALQHTEVLAGQMVKNHYVKK